MSNSDWRTAFDDSVRSMRAGRMTRRSFLQRAAQLGIGASAAATLLEACGGRKTTFLVWESEHDNSGIYHKLVNSFNQTNQHNIHITYRNGPPVAGDLQTHFQTMLASEGASTDILSMDVTWTVPFAGNGWLKPLDKHWPVAARKLCVPAALQPATFAGHVWGAPVRIDLGMIYYRTDLVSRPPRSFAELTTLANNFQTGEQINGFLWTGSQSEGLVCQFTEVLHGYGGSVVDARDPYTLRIDTPEASAALGTMLNWVRRASPPSVLALTEDSARLAWQNGTAAMMRNWISARPADADPSAKAVSGKIGIEAMVANRVAVPGHSCVGGWDLGINAYSRAPDAAWIFIEYMISAATQRRAALEGGLLVAHSAIYDDTKVLDKQPQLARAKGSLPTALPRPITPAYALITLAMQKELHGVLTQKTSVPHALSTLQAYLQAADNRARPLPAT